MDVRKYGKKPFAVAVLHGGPGAPGYMAPVARELSHKYGVLEPLQSKDSIDGQIEELKDQLDRYADYPVNLIGSSWGAVLALFIAARYRKPVSKLVLIGSAVFDAASSASIQQIRLSRLTDRQRVRHNQIQEELKTTDGNRRDKLMAEWGVLLDGTDMYDPVTRDLEVIEVQSHVFSRVWPEFEKLRDKPGYLINEFSRIDKPVTVIHGDYDPHPLSGIRPFLESCIEDIEFHIMPNCGHYPWVERQAKDQFYDILDRVLGR